ncbi:hypothetical protein [Pseudoxanthomonas dokdonensis]|uniref:Uncharacterized protein n=1 Tax=Pseudoxanthomonas dokdonensis TaxID=344882 RepID=A0A0R0CKF3_9GAMM|nr:hypothetical protein [Pseudoxanthomonas dokdonensis]KRG69814.1 hypothetical protein ABB29_08450 [Pseudoxanthomonas dokdonensis]
MNVHRGYAVFLFPQALEALGDAIKPYLADNAAGPHLLCREIDTGGALFEMTLEGTNPQGETVQVELMLPGSMVKLVVSAQNDGAIGFVPRVPASDSEKTDSTASMNL